MLAMLLLVGAVAVAVLIGTGIIDTNPTRQVKEGRRINAKSGGNELSAPRLLEVNHANAPNILTNDPNFFQDNTYNAEKHLPPQNSVVNVFTGQIRISNMEWDDNLARNTSELFYTLSSEFEKNLKNLFTRAPVDNGSQVMVKVNEFVPGSVIVKYTVGWLADNVVLKASDVRNTLMEQTKIGNGKLFGKFVVAKETIAVDYVMDECDERRCEHQCQYFFTELRFVCLCPDDMNNGQLAECSKKKESSTISDAGNVTTEHSQNQDYEFHSFQDSGTTNEIDTTAEPYTSTESINFYITESYLEVKKSRNEETEIAPEPESPPESVPEPEPVPETKPELEPTISPEPEGSPEPEISPEPESIPELDSSPEPKTSTEPESSPEPEISPEPENSPEPESSQDPESSPEPESSSEPKSSPRAQK